MTKDAPTNSSVAMIKNARTTLKRGDDQRRADEKVKERQDAGCAAGEHVFTNSDGRKACVKD
jgi:hypothetical protein